MSRLIASFIILVFGLLLVACASRDVDVAIGDREDLYFTGRGAAAGIMMDSLLGGGTGVAIGIAIDEGIAKDVASALSVEEPEFDIRTLVRRALAERAAGGGNIKNLKSIIIDRYGFQSANDDNVVPLLELQLICSSNTVHQVSFVSSEGDDLSIPFDQVKSDGALVRDKLNGAIAATLNPFNLALCDSN